jgi:transposase-like protein
MAKYRKYSKEFKLQAAKFVTEQGYSYQNTGIVFA